jgi:cell division protein FtsX
MKKIKRIIGTITILMASALILIIGNFINLHKTHHDR